MPRTKGNKNINNYHFKIEYKNADNITEYKYYFTREDIKKDYNITEGTIFQTMKHKKKIRKYPEIISITRVNIPAYQKVLIEL